MQPAPRRRRGVPSDWVGRLLLAALLLAILAPARAAAPDAGGPFAPREHPSSEGSPVDAVIVTSAALAPAFQVLADWHLARGTRCVVRDLDWIAANYPPGRDRAENIRFFLQDARARWGLGAVILGGDTDVIPARYAWSYFHGPTGEAIPTDLYYSCLDGSWNADGDAYWCEASYLGQPGDGADLVPELWLGRLPVSTSADAAALVAKLIAYRETTRTDFQDRLLFLAEVLTPSTWEPGDDFAEILVDGGFFDADLIANALSPAQRHTELFQSWENPFWAATQAVPAPLSVHAALDSLALGNWAFVDQNGHGFRYNMSVGDGSVGVAQALALDNALPFHLTLMNCSSNAFDFDCLGESFLRNATGGAMAVFGSTRDSYPFSSWRYPDRYYRALFREGLTQPGAALRAMRLALAPVSDSEGSSRWTYLILNFLGDPLLDLWTAAPRTLALEAPAAVAPGWQEIEIGVTSGGAPLAGARVTLQKAGEVWSSGTSDAAGRCRLPATPLSAGELALRVWAPNAFEAGATIAVSAPGGAALHLADWALSDPPASDPRNDADGRFEAGETIRLSPTIANSGGAASPAFRVRLSALDDSLTVVSATESFAALPAGGQATGTGALTLRSAVGCADGAALRLELRIEDLAQQPLHRDTLALLVHAPAPVLAEWRFTDVGNGDGIWDESEAWRGAPRWVNLGSGSGGVLAGALWSLDADLVIEEGSVTLPALELLAEGRPAPGFLLRRANAGVPAEGVLRLTDAFGRSWEDSLDFAPPPAPSGLSVALNEGVGRLELRWEPVAAADLAGYLVYFAQGDPGVFMRATLLPLPHAGITLEGLAENSETWVYVTAVDAGGMESASSDTLYTSTNPAQLSGFPQATIGASSCPVAVGNVAGDAGLELVCGADLLYVWHADGSEPLDGDLDPQTIGIYNTSVRDVVGAVTLVPRPGSPYRAIAVATRNIGGASSRKLYLVGENGQVLPGWPRNTIEWIWANLVAADLDGDGDYEIAGIDRSGNLYAFHLNGSELVDGDNNPATIGVLKRNLGTFADGSPAAADLDGDGRDELVVMGGVGHRSLHVFNGDGSELAGWPVNLDPTNQYPTLKESCPLLLANLDGDAAGTLEIVLHSDVDSLYVFRADGSRYPGFPKRFVTNSSGVAPGPLAVDADGDGERELFVVEFRAGYNSALHLINLDGSELAGWPIELAMHAECSPVAGDLDGDGTLEFVQGSEQGVIYGFRADGSVQPGFPIAVGGEVRGTPSIADLDGDGDCELAVSTWNKHVLVWDFSGPFTPERVPWPTLSGSALRRGVAGLWDAVPAAVSEVSLGLTPDGAAALIAWRVGDPTYAEWDLEGRRRPAGGDWDAPRLLAAGLAPGAGGWCAWREAALPAGGELELTAIGHAAGEPPLRVLLGRLAIPAVALRSGLVGSFPNPFNPSTTITFSLAAPGRVSLDILGVDGRRLARLADETLPAGRHERLWDGRDGEGRPQASGVYLAQLRWAGGAESRRLLLLK